MTNSTNYLLMAVTVLGMLAYGVLDMVMGLVNGEKRMAMPFQTPFTVGRWRNPWAFWFYTGGEAVCCVILGYFAFRDLSGLL